MEHKCWQIHLQIKTEFKCFYLYFGYGWQMRSAIGRDKRQEKLRDIILQKRYGISREKCFSNCFLAFSRTFISSASRWPSGTAIDRGKRRKFLQSFHAFLTILVCSGNAVVQQMLGKWLDVNDTSDWPCGLGKWGNNLKKKLLITKHNISVSCTKVL